MRYGTIQVRFSGLNDFQLRLQNHLSISNVLSVDYYRELVINVYQ